MIRGVHAMFYSDRPDETRAYLRDKLALRHFDVGGGWLIFPVERSEVGVHPVDHEGAPPTGTHDISFWCDDIHAEVAAMRERRVEFSDDITDQGYGFVIHFEIPGGIKGELFQKKYGG